MRFLTVTCPFCWQTIEVEAPGFEEQVIEMTTDCEVCCRPMNLIIVWNSPDEEPSITVEPES